MRHHSGIFLPFLSHNSAAILLKKRQKPAQKHVSNILRKNFKQLLRTDSKEWVHRIMGSLDRMLVGIENLAVGNLPVLGGERYLTNKEVSAQLKLSRRTLQENYREAYMSGK